MTLLYGACIQRHSLPPPINSTHVDACYSLPGSDQMSCAHTDPPPINPLPVKADVTLISLISPSASLSDFKQFANNDRFVYIATILIQNITSDSSVNVHLHGYYHNEEGLQ